MAPQAMAPNMHTPIFRLRGKSISTRDSKMSSRPFSPSKVTSFISGVSTVPSFSAIRC